MEYGLIDRVSRQPQRSARAVAEFFSSLPTVFVLSSTHPALCLLESRAFPTVFRGAALNAGSISTIAWRWSGSSSSAGSDRRLGQQHRRAAALSRFRRFQQADLSLHQLARWLSHGGDGDLRHDAIHQVAGDHHLLGFAASMGAFLLCAGNKGKRLALPPLADHDSPPLGGTGRRQASDIEIEAKEIPADQKAAEPNHGRSHRSASRKN